MNRLIVSMIIKIGIRSVGVPSGNRCPREAVGWFRIPINTVDSHIGTASAMFIDSCVVGVNVYGNRPRRFRNKSRSVRASRVDVHLWPGRLIGAMSCFAKVLDAHS